MSWSRFLVAILGLAVGAATLLGAAVMLIDPFDVLPFSPPWPRAPMDANQRYAYPAVARNRTFDSAVIGTSAGRLLRPEALEAELGGRFAALAMNAATPWEQAQIFWQFRRHREEIRAVVFEIDKVWCKRDLDERNTRPFPEWMYDEDPWNDLVPHLSLYAIEQAGRQAAYLLGMRPARFAANGYASYLPDGGLYDLERVRRRLAEESEREADGAPALDRAGRADLAFPYHPLMAEMLASLPDQTLKVLLFPPVYFSALPQPGSKGASIIAECKARVAALARSVANAVVLDFMIESEITRDERNFWDSVHTTEATADRIVALIAEGLRERRGRAGLFRYLGATPDG